MARKTQGVLGCYKKSTVDDTIDDVYDADGMKDEDPHPEDASTHYGSLSESSAQFSSEFHQDEIMPADARAFEAIVNSKHIDACRAMSEKRYKDSLQIFQTILSDVLARYGGTHKKVGASLHNLAIANLRVGKLKQAKEAIDEAIRIRIKKLGRKHSKTIDSTIEKGIILLTMDNYTDALSTFQESLKLRQSIGGGDHEKTLALAKIYNNIGCVFFESSHLDSGKVDRLEQASQNFDKSIELFGMVYGIWSKIFRGKFSTIDTGYLAMASAICNKAFVHMRKKDLKGASQYLSQSIQIQTELLGRENKLVQDTMHYLGYCLISLGEIAKAHSIYLNIWQGQMVDNSIKEEKILTLKRIVYCEMVLCENELALKHLGYMEDILLEDVDDDDSAIYENQEFKEIRRFMGEVNYELLKYPFCADSASRICCTLFPTLDDQEINFKKWYPPEPKLLSKMSCHRLANV